MSLPHINSTQIPNIIFDYWMAILTPGEFKVLLCICRKTYGWHKARDSISLSQIVKMTGLSRKGVQKIIPALEAHGLIQKDHSKAEEGDSNPNWYEIHLEELSSRGGELSTPPVGNSVRHGVANSVRPQKKDYTKERLTNKYTPPDGGEEEPPPPSLSDAPKPKPTPPSPFRTVCRHERVAHLPAHEDFQKHFNQPLVATSHEEHQKLVTKHGEEKVKRAYEHLAEWKLSKASSEPKKVLSHTDYFRLTKWVMKEILDSMPGGSRSFQRRGKLAISADERAKSEQHVYEDASVMSDEEKARAKAAYEKMRKDAQARTQEKT